MVTKREPLWQVSPESMKRYFSGEWEILAPAGEPPAIDIRIGPESALTHGNCSSAMDLVGSLDMELIRLDEASVSEYPNARSILIGVHCRACALDGRATLVIKGRKVPMKIQKGPR